MVEQDLQNLLPALFSQAGDLCPWPGDPEGREVEAGGVPFRFHYLPWRLTRRGVPGMAPMISDDRGERIIREEALWTGDGLAITPNRYPFAARHLLLWEASPLREPSVRLLVTLLELVASRRELLGLVNTIGGAATVARAHGQLAELPEATGVFALDLSWEAGPGYDFAFPDPGTGWPIFFLALRGEPRVMGQTLERLMRQRRCPAFNILAREGVSYFFFRSLETVPAAYPLPLGALELSGIFGFEGEDAFRAMTPERVMGALGGAGYPVTPEAREAVQRALDL